MHPYAISKWRLELMYDATLADGPPVVALDLRYGATVIDALDTSVAGRVSSYSHSAGAASNASLPGAIFTVVLPSRADVAVVALSTVTLGPATALFDAAGDPIVLEVDVDRSHFIAEVVAAAAFEGGGFTEWWNFVH